MPVRGHIRSYAHNAFFRKVWHLPVNSFLYRGAIVGNYARIQCLYAV